MYKMSPSEIQEIRTKLAVVEALVKEKWEAHDVSSKKHWDDIALFHTDMRVQLEAMSKILRTLPCDTRIAISEKDKETYDKDQAKIWDTFKMIGGAIVAIVLAMIYAFFGHITGGGK